MGGQDDQAIGVHVDEGHHDGGFRIGRVGQLAGAVLVLGRGGMGGGVFSGVIEGGFIAMVAVGDDELLVVHGGDEEADGGGVGDAPEAVKDAVFVGDLGFGGAVLVVEDLFHAAGGIGVEHEDLAEVGMGGFEQVEAVALGLGQGLLMAEDNAIGVVMEAAEGDKAAAFLDYVAARNFEALGIGEDAGVFFLDQDAVLAPLGEIVRGTGVDAFTALGIEELREPEDDAHQVVGAALVVGLLHGRRDFVIGLGDYVAEPDSGRIVAPGAEWINAGHTEGLAPQEKVGFVYFA